MSTLNDELEFIELAGDKIRNVASAEGAIFYGLPIGSPITSGVEAQKKAEAAALGITPPKGGIVDGQAPTALPQTPEAKAAAKATAEAAKAAEAQVPEEKTVEKPKISPSSISGNMHFEVGGSKYSAPGGSKLIKPKSGAELAFVLTPEDKLHAFNGEGEVAIPVELQKALATKFSGDLTNDPHYDEADFDGQSSSYSLSAIAIGGVLTDKDKNPIFKKLPDGTWEYIGLGTIVTDKDIQGLYDSGDLLPKATKEDKALQESFAGVEATNFSELSQDEFTAALEALPEKAKLSVDSISKDTEGTTLTKLEDGKWKASTSDTLIQSADLFYIKDTLKLGKAKPVEKPEGEKSAPAKTEKKTAKAPSDAPKAPAEAPKAEAPKTPEVASDPTPGKISSYKEFQALPIGVSTSYSAGAYSETYTKVSANGWVAASDGDTLKDSHFENAIAAGYLTLEAVSVEAPAPDEQKTPVDLGDTIHSVEHMDGLKAGTSLAYAKPNGKTSTYTKLDSGKWLTPNGSQLGSSELGNSAKSGNFSISELPVAAPKATAADQITFEGSAEIYTKEDVQAALDALEGHSSFQIAYGLKSVPDNPITKAGSDKIKVWAATAYPNLKPKAGAVALFKDKLGIKPAKAEKVASPEVNIGSDSPKSTATGMTGGVFTQADIQEAVTILEGFEGKVFKSELNKKGNPLGALNFNDIVGFSKDKQETKQKVIDLLKTKLDKLKVTEADVVTPDAPAKLDLGTPEKKKEGDLLAKEDVPSAEPGTVVEYEDENWTKLASGLWEANDGHLLTENFMSNRAKQGQLTLISYPQAAPAPVAEEPAAPVVTDPETAWDAEVGTSIKLYGNTFTKGTGNYWFAEDGSSVGATSLSVQIKNGKVSGLTPPAPSKPKSLPVVPLDVQFSDYPISTMLQDDAGLAYAKISDNLWISPGGPNKSDSDWDFEVLSGDAKILSVPETPVVEAGGITTLEQFKQLPIGQQVSVGTASTIYTKTAENTWSTGTKGIYTHPDAAFKTFIGKDLKVLPFTPAAPDKEDKTPVKLTSFQQFQDLPEGSVVQHSLNKKTFTKTGKATWTSDSSGAEIVETSFEPAINGDKISVVSTPAVDTTPDKKVLVDSVETLKSYPVGTVINYSSGNTNYDLTKTGPEEWLAQGYPLDEADIHMSVKNGTIFLVSLPDKNSDTLAPGKYQGSGVVYMEVLADGTGLYFNKKGESSKLSANKVKANYEAGMNNFTALVVAPTLTPDPDLSVNAPVAISKPKTVKDIPEGIYYSGLPSDKKTIVYTVSGETVLVHKPLSSTAGSSQKIGQKTDSAWYNAASTGAQFKYSYGNNEKPYTKQADGTWTKEDGTVVSANVIADVTSYYSYYQIVSHGKGDAVEMPIAKLKTSFAKGKLLDAYGNSVLPAGYSGEMYLFGAPVTPSALFKLNEALNDPANNDKYADAIAKSLGVLVTDPRMKPYIVDNYGAFGELEAKAGLKKKISELLDGLEVAPPEGKATDLFTWNAQGEAAFPKELVDGVFYDKASQLAFIEKASQLFGNGEVIGLYAKKLNLDGWITSFKQGNLKNVYDYEVNAAAELNMSHSAGWLHPGYSGNSETNTVIWAAAVPDEVSALKKVPGDWTSPELDPSTEEVANYLISAQMQNPTFLTVAERRSWVKNHRSGNKIQVDLYSVTAEKRKLEGQAPKSDPVVWTDDVKPAKSYTSILESEEFPISGWSGWGNSAKALSFVNDSYDNAELMALWDTTKATNVYDGDQNNAVTAVKAYFQAKKDAADALALIPVYTKDATQTVKASTHPVFQYHDQFGKKYFFKPRNDTKLDKYRSEAEHLGNSLGRFWGYSSADSQLVTIDGKYGQLQNAVSDVVGDLMNADYSTLSGTQLGDVANEHVLDWLLDNDDTKGDNALLTGNGRIVGLDKGRAFKHFGAWKGLSGDGQMDSNAATIYNAMFSAMRSGKISKENADKAYLIMQKKISKIQKSDDARFTELLQAGMQNRTDYDINYKINGKAVPANFEGLRLAVLDRKSKLDTELAGLWTKVYKDSGFGSLPELPDNPLGDVISGMDDSRLHEEVFLAKATGKTTIVGNSAGVVGGTVLMWTDEMEGGSTNINGEMFLGDNKQQELLDFLISHASDGKTGEVGVEGFANLDSFGTPIVLAAKTISHHAVDKEYPQAKIDGLMDASFKINTEMDEWAPDLTSNGQLNGSPSFTFSTGTKVPMVHLNQYKMMLDQYSIVVPQIIEAHSVNSKSPIVEMYKPLILSKGSEKFITDNGASLTKLNDGSWIYVDYNGSVSLMDAAAGSAKSQTGEFFSATVVPEVKSKGFTVVKNSYTNEKTATHDGTDTKTISKHSANGVSGSPGHEFEVTLDTGEKIFFRNQGHTKTAMGQHGKLMFRADGVTTPEASQEAVERIVAQLGVMGVNLADRADHEDAELIYWREMANVLEHRKHKTGSSYAKAQKAMHDKRKEVGGTAKNFLENLNAKMSKEEEITFWRDLWSTHFNPKMVDDMLAKEGYLPKYDHQNLNNPELETGKPYWERLDVDLEAIAKSGSWLAASSGGEPLQQTKSGAFLGGEERLRQMDNFVSGGYSSASQDQSKGSSHNIYTRLINKDGYNGFNAFFDPRQMARTRVYSFGADHYGDMEQRAAKAPSDPMDAIKNWSDGHGSNETSLSHMATILDGIEVLGFDSASKRNEAIQHLKSKGILIIRGISVEDRLVMQKDVGMALKKARAQWSN